MFSYTVRGRVGPNSPFPGDMLRYDMAWPAGSDDAAEMFDNREPHVIEVRLLSYERPTTARWSSFLWGVGEVTLYSA
jgi:hypothetical protein